MMVKLGLKQICLVSDNLSWLITYKIDEFKVWLEPRRLSAKLTNT
jgi:hypothetical protein